MTGRRIAVLVLLALASAQASARGRFFGFTEDYSAGAGDVGTEAEARWRFALGAGLGAGPNFQGSDKYRIRPAPFVFAGYGRFFVGFGGAGVNLYRTPGWGFGAIVSPSGGRRTSTSASPASATSTGR
jgi:outer membrane scaffolding protein for murein synthesis (MipA/OmpV family)